MKINTNTATLERNQVLNKHSCTMQASAMTFRMLSKQYSNPIKACIQELSANAYDSHVAAGNTDRPFDVKLPNSLDTSFKIRDYGVSMDHDTILNVYCDYMNSTKRNTNNMIGAFGIGSKTPFAIDGVDSFNVTCYLNGIKRLYVLAYNELGIPELNELGTYKTDEDNGVEISFSVKENTSIFDKFKREAYNVFKFFDVKPNISGQQLVFDQTNIIIDNNNWKLIYDDNNASNLLIVVMGNIAYTTSYDLLRPYKHKLSYNQSIILKVPIGSVDITPSRESLEYSEKTSSYLNTELSQIFSCIDKKAQEKIDTYNSLYELLEDDNMYKLASRHDCSFKNIPVNSSSIQINYKITYYYKYYNKVKKNSVASLFISPSKKQTNVFICAKDYDDKYITEAKCRYFVSQNDCVLYIVDATEKELLDALHGGDYCKKFLLDPRTMPSKPKTISTSGPNSVVKTKPIKHHIKVYNYSCVGDNTHAYKHWKKVSTDKTNKDIYFGILHNGLIYDSKLQRRYALTKIIETIKVLNPQYQIPTIVGLTHSESRKLSHKWTNIGQWIEKIFYDFCPKNKMIEYNISLDCYNLQQLFSGLCKLIKHKSKITNINILNIIKEYERRNSISTEIPALCKLFEDIYKIDQLVIKKNDISDVFNKFIKDNKIITNIICDIDYNSYDMSIEQIIKILNVL